MAIWQCDFQLIPNCRVDNLEKECFWEGYTVDENSLKMISKFLPKTISWSDDIIQYGDNDDTCIQLFFQDGVLYDIRIRISFRDIEQSMLSAIVDFAKTNKGMFVLNKTIIVPEVNKLIDVIKSSEAFNFSVNPKNYLSSLCD